MTKKKLIYTIASIILLLDQLIKVIVVNNMELHQEIKIIKNFFSIYYVKNTGAAFSILGNQTLLLIVVSCLCLILIKEYIKKEKNITTISMTSLGLIVGGTLGNLFDRIIYHAVIDYLSFDIFKYSFPVFNLADIAITIGTFLLVIGYIIENRAGDKNERTTKKLQN